MWLPCGLSSWTPKSLKRLRNYRRITALRLYALCNSTSLSSWRIRHQTPCLLRALAGILETNSKLLTPQHFPSRAAKADCAPRSKARFKIHSSRLRHDTRKAVSCTHSDLFALLKRISGHWSLGCIARSGRDFRFNFRRLPSQCTKVEPPANVEMYFLPFLFLYAQWPRGRPRCR